MQALLLSILLNAFLGVVFVYFGKYKVQLFQAIVFNYLTCVVIAALSLGQFPVNGETLHQRWFLAAVLIAFFFIAGFNAAAQTIRHFGITTGAIMQKMSLAFTVLFSFWVLHEPMNVYKWAGALAGILAIIYMNYPERTTGEKIKLDLRIAFPILTLVLATGIDIGFAVLEKQMKVSTANAHFVGTLFALASALGLLILGYLLVTGKTRLEAKSILAGIILGIPNYGAIYFWLKALGSELTPAEFYTFNNVGIILLSAIIAIFVFKDKFNKHKYRGLAFSIAAILLMYFGGKE